MYINKRRLRPKALYKCVVGIPEPTIWHSKHHVRVVRRDVACQSYAGALSAAEINANTRNEQSTVRKERKKRRMKTENCWHFIVCFSVALATAFLLDVYFMDWVKKGNTTVLFSVFDIFSIWDQLVFPWLVSCSACSLVWDHILWLCLQMCMHVC